MGMDWWRRRRGLRSAWFVALAALAAVLAHGRGAAAQSGWSVDRFEPAPAGDLFLASQYPTFDRARPVSLRFALVNGYALRPLVASVTTADAVSTVVAIEHALVTHFQANAHIAQRLGVDLALPVYWLQTGSNDATLPVRAADGVAAGDLRFGARARVVGHADTDPASLHLGASVHVGFLGLASPAQNTSDGRVRARFFAAGAGRAGRFRWSVTAGFHARPGVDPAIAQVGSELFANAGAGVVLADERLMLGAEGSFAGAVSPFFVGSSVHLEALAVARLTVLDGALALGGGIGPGFTQAVGTPALRAVLSLTYSPRLPAPRVVYAAAGGPSPPARAASASAGARATRGASAPASRASTDTTASAAPPASYCDGADAATCSTGDRDGDHVFEPLDVCPDTPAGAVPDPRRAGCPATDTDNDGVADGEDQCASEPRGAVPDPARAGCPLPDRDGDRIADAEDHCPDQAGAPHPDPNVNGCPGLVQLDAGVLRILQPLYFATGRATLQARSTPVLEGVRQALRARPEIRRVVVAGHTDDRGNSELNVDLSHRRAAAVVRWLTDHGIEPTRLSPQGFGPTQPRVTLEPRMTRAQREAARAQNRRVQFELVTP